MHIEQMVKRELRDAERVYRLCEWHSTESENENGLESGNRSSTWLQPSGQEDYVKLN